MSKIVASAVIRGAKRIVSEAENFLSKAIEEKGEKERVGFPETAFYLPLSYALLGLEAKTVGDLVEVLREAKSLLKDEPTKDLWLPYLGDALDCGIATLLAEEVICALRYLYGLEPQKDCIGFYTDTWQRKYGIQLVDGRMPGFAAILGAAPNNRIAVEIVREFQKKNIICFVGSSYNQRSIIDQLLEENVELGWETYIVPYGRDTITAIYPLNWAIRAALTFGGHKKGEAKTCLKYCQDRVFAFGLVLGGLDDLKYATGAGAISMGFPIICDTDIPEIRPSGITTYEALVKEFDYKKIISKCIETRGVKIKVSKVDIPVPYAAAFEGERVRRENLYVEFGGKASVSFEYLRSRNLDEVEDGKIELFGPDIDNLKEDKNSMPLGILVEVAGRKMQKDFEPILERQIHRFINYCMGVMHIGQRDMNWIRISQDSYKKGLRLKHLGVVIHAMLHSEYGAIVDKVQVKIYTELKDVEKLLLEARRAYEERDARMGEMTDESVDTFFSCTLCQSFAPNHVCIITPERLGLCGAYSWLDAKASYELSPTGPNQPILKGEILDSKLGQWKNVNDFVYAKSNKTIEKVSMYSIMDHPQSSCVTADTQVIIDNELVTIGEFIDKNRGGENYAKSKALTLKEGKALSERIVAMQRFDLPKGKELIKIKTKSGTELTLTSDHQVAVDRPTGLAWIPAYELKRGDRVISLKKLEIEEKIPDIYDLLPEDFYIRDKELIKELKCNLSKKYGSLSNALKKLSLKYIYNNSLSISYLKIVLKDLDRDYKEIVKSISDFYVGGSLVRVSQQILSKDLFYLMGLIASDGSVFKRGNYEYHIYFINTRKELIDRYKKLYRNIFSERNLHISVRLPRKRSFIKERRINSVKNCYVCYSNNPIFGILLEFFGIIPKKGERNFKNLLSLPKEYISNFLNGLFDGDGNVRLRKYKGEWDLAEGYLCCSTKEQGYYLVSLLKRFGILSNLRKSNSVYKIQLYGRNIYEFSKVIDPIHKEKKELIRKIRSLYKEKEIDKTQVNILPFFVGKRLTELPESKSILSPSTYFYYKTFRSRPTLDNIHDVIKNSNSKGAKFLKTVLNSDFYLDIIKEVKKINTNKKYVYNLTLSNIHCYFANQVLIKNCGCFECIVAIIPEANGFMIVDRDYAGETPCGMSFTTLAGSVGGGIQTPGFLGIGRLYIVSKKFLSAEGGIVRVVWMTKQLKEFLGERLKKRAEEIGYPDLIDKIADETIATDSKELLNFLEKVNHPALRMEEVI